MINNWNFLIAHLGNNSIQQDRQDDIYHSNT